MQAMRTHAALAVLVAWGILAGHASAQWGSSWGANANEYVPYFSLHPPVYYSQPVPRTYGYSPFPYTPDVLTPDPQAKPAAPLLVPNPYVAGPYQGSHGQVTERSIPSPLRIINPYVTQQPGSMKSVPLPAPPSPRL